MPKTILITGSSSGIGRASALHFQQKGWNVAASMRHPEKEAELSKLDRVFCPVLDVTDPASIDSAIARTIERFGSIDVLLNNAGYAVSGAFEDSNQAQIQRQFDTNVFGLMQVIRAILPPFRRQGHGTIINVTSLGGRLSFPFFSLYHATKWSVEGFSESLQYELRPFNIKVRVIEPGMIKTDFYGRSMEPVQDQSDAGYAERAKKLKATTDKIIGFQGDTPDKVAKVIYRAATDRSWKLRYLAAGGAPLLYFFRRLLPDSLFLNLIRIGSRLDR